MGNLHWDIVHDDTRLGSCLLKIAILDCSGFGCFVSACTSEQELLMVFPELLLNRDARTR